MKIVWNEQSVIDFRQSWPCCDVPNTGYAEWDNNGDLVDISDNTRNCEPGGGLSEFLDDLRVYFGTKVQDSGNYTCK
jgi:hypothetical protein